MIHYPQKNPLFLPECVKHRRVRRSAPAWAKRWETLSVFFLPEECKLALLRQVFQKLKRQNTHFFLIGRADDLSVTLKVLPLSSVLVMDAVQINWVTNEV